MKADDKMNRPFRERMRYIVALCAGMLAGWGMCELYHSGKWAPSLLIVPGVCTVVALLGLFLRYRGRYRGAPGMN